MITANLAKSHMEHEEGMNHLWIQWNFPDAQDLGDVRVNIILPKGIQRLENLNGYNEDASGAIWISDLQEKQDLVIEIFTERPVSCGKENIAIELLCKEVKRFEFVLPLLLVTEEEMEDLVMDEEVIARVKELKSSTKPDLTKENYLFDVIKPLYLINKEASDLEKKYRIDYSL